MKTVHQVRIWNFIKICIYIIDFIRAILRENSLFLSIDLEDICVYRRTYFLYRMLIITQKHFILQ